MNDQSSPVRVTDVDMKFMSMVWFMIKWAVASIPAFLVLSMLFSTILVVLMMLIMAMGIANSHH